MSKETVAIPVVRFRDQLNRPTCAANFETGEVCGFLVTQRFGCRETCVFAPMEHNGLNSAMHRRDSAKGEPNEGTLIPGEWCPLWKKEDFA